MSSGTNPTTVIQITNLSPAVTSEQMRTLFSFLGDIEELRLYPPDNAPLPFTSKISYIKYSDPASVIVAQHLTNTVFIDRALIVVPCSEGKIPEESKALSLLAPVPPIATLMPGAGLLPMPTPTTLASLGVSFSPLAALQPGFDPALSALGDVSQPPLMGNVDPSKVDEIRRTIYVGNLNSQSTTAEQLLEFFKQVGEVKFVRMAGDETQPTRFAFVEFSDQASVPRALAFNGVMFGDRPLKINHSNNAIVKPPEMTPQAAAKELEEVMKRVREAQSFISAAIEPETGKAIEKKEKSRSRSRSRSRKKRSHSRHRSRSHHRSPSRSRERRRSRSSHKKRSRSKEKRRSQSRSRSQSRDKRKDRDYKVKSKEKERSKYNGKDDKRKKEKKSKTPPKSYSSSRRSRSISRTKKEKKKDKERERSSERSERERSTSKKSTKDKDRKDKQDKTNIKVERDYDKEEQEYESDKDGERKETKEAEVQQNGSYQLNEDAVLVKLEVEQDGK
ncbi:splicing regulatory glutamine/lysine-rich protein 1 isoform X2 [Latimeria chalumnae]|uniref:splicing regulatory glutamine/lysine-rich protein 1 isoform X2 n=1 Tax=Latimeria chalumnae TaxID=7897 RepID=UPI00313AF427